MIICFMNDTVQYNCLSQWSMCVSVALHVRANAALAFANRNINKMFTDLGKKTRRKKLEAKI